MTLLWLAPIAVVVLITIAVLWRARSSYEMVARRQRAMDVLERINPSVSAGVPDDGDRPAGGPEHPDEGWRPGGFRIVGGRPSGSAGAASTEAVTAEREGAS